MENIYNRLLNIINSKTKLDVKYIEEVIIIAEDTDFSIEQSKIISPWLINFALENRNNNIYDKYVRYSALRTGASMLTPDLTERLIPLLDLNKDIDTTTLVTIKMIKRIFEADPPSESDKHDIVAQRIVDIINLILENNITKISITESVIIELGINSLKLMKSSRYQAFK